MKTINHINPYGLSNIKKLPFIVIFLISVILVSCTQESHSLKTDGAFFAISVSDLDKAVDWYTKHLEFEITSKANNDQRKGALLKRPGIILEIAEFSGAISRNVLKSHLESHEVYGIFKIGFSIKNIDEMFKTLKNSGVDIFFPIINISNGSRTFGIKDMDGNIIQFFGK